MISGLVSRSSGPGLSLGSGHCLVFLGKTLKSHSGSLHPGTHKWVTANLMLEVTLPWTSIPSRGVCVCVGRGGVRNTPSHFMLQNPG